MNHLPSKNRKSTENLIPLRKKDIKVTWQRSFDKNGSFEKILSQTCFHRILNSCKIGFVVLPNQFFTT